MYQTEGGELIRNTVVANYATTPAYGKIYKVEYYNLDVVISWLLSKIT